MTLHELRNNDVTNERVTGDITQRRRICQIFFGRSSNGAYKLTNPAPHVKYILCYSANINGPLSRRMVRQCEDAERSIESAEYSVDRRSLGYLDHFIISRRSFSKISGNVNKTWHNVEI